MQMHSPPARLCSSAIANFQKASKKKRKKIIIVKHEFLLINSKTETAGPPDEDALDCGG